MSISLVMIAQKMKEIKNEAPRLFFLLDIFCEQADNIDKNGEAAKAIIQFFDFVPQQEEVKTQGYNELYNKLDRLLFRNSTSTIFVRECEEYQKQFCTSQELPLFYQCVQEFLTDKVVDAEVKEAINEFIQTNSKEKDTEGIYSTLLSRVVDFNIGNISKKEFIKLLLSPIISQDDFTTRHMVAADTNLTAPVITLPLAAPINKCVSEENSKIYHSYFEDIVFSPAKKESELNGKPEAKYTEYTDNSKETGEIKFIHSGKDWVRNCPSIHLIINNEDKTFLEWIHLFKYQLQQRTNTVKAESSMEDIYASIAAMNESQQAIFMLDFIAALKIHLANTLGLTALTHEQTHFIENAIALVHQHAFGYKMQTELCAALMKNNLAIAKNGKSHVVTIHIELERNEITLIEKGSFKLGDANRVSYAGKTKLEPNAEGVKATNFIRNISATDKFLYEHLIEPAVVLMSPVEVIKKKRSLMNNPRFILERENIVSALDAFLEELKSSVAQENKAEMASKKKWLRLKLYKMENVLLSIDESKSAIFSEQIRLIQEEIENPKHLGDLETFDKFFSGLYNDLGGAVIDYPGYQPIEAQVNEIKTRLESDSISERDLLAAQKNIREFEHYIFPKKSGALETLIYSLEAFRKKHFEPKSYFRIKDSKPIPLQEDSGVLGKKERKPGLPIAKQNSMPVVHSDSAASSSFMRRRVDSVSMFSPERRTEVSSTSSRATPQQKHPSREKTVEPSDLFIFRLT